MPDRRTSALINYAKRCLREGDRAQAKKIAQQLIAKEPGCVEGWLILGGLTEPRASLFYFDKARQIRPNDPRVKAAIAWAKQELGDEGATQQISTSPNTLRGTSKIQSIPRSTRTEDTSEGERRNTFFKQLNRNAFFRGFVHLARKGLLIALTIFLGVFITINIMNRDVVVGWGTAPAQLDIAVKMQIERTINTYMRQNREIMNLPLEERTPIMETMRESLIAESGLNLPKFQKHLLWTWNALKLDWGRLQLGSHTPVRPLMGRSTMFNLNRELILGYLPNTVLLAASAFLIVFLLGLPLALFLSRNYGKWFDKLVSFFAPLSSIPSWIIGIVLIALFAFELQILPAGRMYDAVPPDTFWGYIPVVLRHMILPVLSIALSIFFQLVYSWRTYFITFSSEDYVELGKAKGLSNRSLQRKYVLRPSLSYVITSFSLMFVSFWQMTMALEVVFNWPGLGWLYVVKGLPNLWGESVYPGDLLISVTLVVMFAYLMGTIVLTLDLVYVLVDPRVRLGRKDPNLRLKRRKGWLLRTIRDYFKALKAKSSTQKDDPKPEWRGWNHHTKADDVEIPRRQTWQRIKNMFREMFRYPSAVIGFIIILILILGSLYAVIFLPYEKIGEEWKHNHFTGQPSVPQLARPAWINWFRDEDYLSVLSLDTTEGSAQREVIPLTEKTDQVLLTFSFDYDYAEFPDELLLYLTSEFEEKRPFASVFWRTPDDREITLENTAIDPETTYPMEESVPYYQLLDEHPEWREWFDPRDSKSPPVHYLLFAEPGSEEPRVLAGRYEMVVDGLIFEEEGDINGELTLLGQVYGAAGTDFYRRDLLVPLLWGMPFALILGLFGALSTTIISMIFAATGVWFGGWVDNLVQRLIDVNLVMPILAIAVMAYAFLGISLWTILIVYVFLNAFGTPTKNFRAAFLQIKESPYIEAAKAYGATNTRIIFRYMVPRLIPVLIPQLVILIPSFVFLEATLGFFNIKMTYPTWGVVIYQATMRSNLFYSRFWMLQPIGLLLLTGLGFSLFGFALERILNPRLQRD